METIAIVMIHYLALELCTSRPDDIASKCLCPVSAHSKGFLLVILESSKYGGGDGKNPAPPVP